MSRFNQAIITCIVALLLAALAACGCGRGDAVSQPSGECFAIADRFDAVLAGATGACRTNADCACYNPVSRKSGCGGITDKKSADLLRMLGEEFHRAKCNWWVRCAPWACSPACVRDRCGNGR